MGWCMSLCGGVDFSGEGWQVWGANSPASAPAVKDSMWGPWGVNVTGFAISKRVGFSGRAELHLLVFPLPLWYLSSLVASFFNALGFPSVLIQEL